MTALGRNDVWASGDLYEPYVGRWSRLVARDFLDWLGLPGGLRWLDVGCGTGALSQTVLDRARPREVAGADPSEGYVAHARARVADARASFRVADARSLPFEGRRFPVCRPEPLAVLFRRAGLARIDTRPIDVPTVFRDFEDYWTPFLGGQAPAPGYCMSLSEDRRAALRELIRAKLPRTPDGRISLIARAWAVRGRVPDIW